MLSQSVFSAVFVALVYYYYPEMKEIPKETGANQGLYDFIIVGAGSAGCVLARRLSEIRSWRILLIEAGGDETLESKTPFFNWIQRNNALDWNYTTVRQKNACLATSGICDYPRGHVMGGSSSINVMVYNRGNALEYDDWEKVHGAKGWTYKDILPYFIKAENNNIPELQNSSYHGHSGPFYVQHSNHKSAITETMFAALQEIGLPINDYNGERQNGFSRTQLTLNNGIRWSTSSGYLNRAPRNLDIVKHAKVTKVLFDQNTKRAVGVQFVKDGTFTTIRAKREVILSSGSINSPQLLILSGIGPKEELNKLNIPIIADLPVGRILQDHLFLVFPFILKNYTNDNVGFTDINALLEFAKNKSGPYASNSNPIMGYANTLTGNLMDNPPNLLFNLINAFPSMKDRSRFYLIMAGATPKSIGSLKLVSNDIKDQPLIDPNYLSDEYDLNSMLSGLKFLIEVMKTKALEGYQPEIDKEYLKMCPDTGNFDEFLICSIKTYSNSMYHPVGTCKMGSTKSNTSVVDNEGRVIGVRGLRVIDGSIIPFVPNANTNAAIVMLAEKLSDTIKRNYKVIR